MSERPTNEDYTDEVVFPGDGEGTAQDDMDKRENARLARLPDDEDRGPSDEVVRVAIQQVKGELESPQFAEAVASMIAAPKRPVKFNFGGDGEPFDKVFDGFTDDTRWNGWLNVWVTVEEYRTKIRPMFVPTGNAEDFEDNSVEDIDAMATAAEAAGELVSLANCYTTLEVEPEA